jgi:serine/threonine protein kinase
VAVIHQCRYIARSDIYSLGMLLYELLTSTTPFRRDELRNMGYDEICHAIRHSEPPPPSSRLSTLGDAAAGAARDRQTDPAGLRRRVHGDLRCSLAGRRLIPGGTPSETRQGPAAARLTVSAGKRTIT